METKQSNKQEPRKKARHCLYILQADVPVEDTLKACISCKSGWKWLLISLGQETSLLKTTDFQVVCLLFLLVLKCYVNQLDIYYRGSTVRTHATNPCSCSLTLASSHICLDQFSIPFRRECYEYKVLFSICSNILT